MTQKRRSTQRDQSHEHIHDLLSKHGQVVAALAHSLLERVPGDRVTRMQEYAARLDASVGTVQAAISHLTTVGAASFEMRGRLGTYVTELNYPLLWSLAMRRPLVGALPLPYSYRFAGLATALREQFDHLPLNVELRFMRGASQRARALETQQCDWALISRHAVEEHLRLDVVASLGADTYMAGHVLLLRSDAAGIQNGMRVGVDPTSSDHAFIVHAACQGRHVDYIEIEYAQGLQQVIGGAIDATVWSREDVPSDIDSLVLLPLTLLDYPALVALGEAVIVVDHGNRAVTALLKAALDMQELRQIQQDVISHRRMPAY